ncbi:endolytic transglycosylase MltG [Camelliibacillus cellulosilyticus]|uniref:Endolytic murein transglycosylase n=1 Tax=Camelliibacillus cellulosilyticus TaxID=2174486 RepID=A0ABV9GN49_9BACL
MPQSDDQLQKKRERAEEARLVRRIVFIIVAAFVVIVACGAGFTYYYINRALKPVDASSHKQIVVQIPSGTGTGGIGKILEEKGVIKNATVFRYYCKYKNENGFIAGTYRLSPSMSIDQIINRIESGRTYDIAALKLTIPEGFWIKDIAARIAKKTNLKEQDILATMSDRDYIKTHYMKDYPFLKDVILDKRIKYPLEGYLFPATYHFTKKNPDLDTIIKAMLNKTSAVLAKYKDSLSKSKLRSVHQVLTMASLVEDEATKEVDRRKIAGVFFKRLKQGMLLQTDPTVSYAEQRHIIHYKQSELAVDSPYNTYKYKGLPVGPINNPSEASIKAVLNPLKTDDLYFYARPNGQVLFSKTLNEHEANVKKYQSEWSKVKEE